MEPKFVQQKTTDEPMHMFPEPPTNQLALYAHLASTLVETAQAKRKLTAKTLDSERLPGDLRRAG